MPGIQEEIKAELSKQGEAFEAFKNAVQKQLDETKTGGISAETQALVDKTNSTVQEIQNRIRELETATARPPVTEGAEGARNEPLRAAFNAMIRERDVAPEFRAALVEDNSGRILVPEDLEADIRRTIGKVNIMRTLASVRTTSREKVRRRRITEVVMGWGKLEEGGGLVESSPVPSEEFLWVEDLRGLVRIGEDELEDADMDLSGYLEDSFGRAAAEKEETAFVLGTGRPGRQPEGFTLGSTVARVVAGQAAAIKVEDVLKLMYAVKGGYRRNGSFLVNSTTELAMRLFKDANGQLLWQPSLQLDTPATFSGRPVYNQEDLENIPAAGTAKDVAAFGDWKAGYEIVDRKRITIKRLEEKYATEGMVGFLAQHRVAGGVTDAEALRILRVPASV